MKKGIVLVIVFGILIVISLLAVTAINLMRQQSKITEHKISRRRKLLAAQAGMVHALEELRKGNDPTGSNVLNINGLDVDILYTPDGSGLNGTNPVEITVD
ncbi:MAG: hypothetical protein K9M01_01435 [Candidatus Omnitrophica bacterium]|nr:hypothetical protein [Candidatus Omnitrophota bacterium]